MKPPENQLDALWSIVETLVMADKNAEALCYASLAIAWRDTGYYQSLLCERGVTEASVQHCANLIDSEFESGGRGVLELIRRSPLGLLSWLDKRLSNTVVGSPHTYRNQVYQGEVIPCKISHEIGTYLEFPSFWHTAYLVRRRGDLAMQGRISEQGLSQHRFTPSWFVIPDTPDSNQRSRKIEVVSAEDTFRRACLSIQKRGQMNIYTAEFAIPPVFASTYNVVGGVLYWKAQGLHNEAIIADDAVAHVRKAASMGADVLIFPELTVPPRVLDSIVKELSSSRTGISLVVAGSFHEQQLGVDQVRNVTHLLDGFGNSIKLGSTSTLRSWIHDKLNPVRIEQPNQRLMQEDLKVGNLITLVNTPIGLHSILNCLDLAQAAVISAVRVEFIPQQFLFSPSMSESVSAHREHAKNIHLNHGTVVACANQAQADFGDKNTIDGAVMKSFVYGAQRNQLAMQLDSAQFFVVNL